MKQTILILFLSSMILTGCDLEKKSNDNDGSVRFVVYQPSEKEAAAQTKVSGTNFDQGDEISVFAPLAGNPIHGNYDLNAAGGTGAKDMRYIADQSNRFTAKTEDDKIKYSNTETKLDFYAVYPAMGPGPKYAVVDQTNYTIDLGDISQQTGGAGKEVVPYIYSNNAKNKGTGDGVVALVFRNVLTKIAIDVKYDRESLEADLTKIELYADGGLYRECVIDLKNGDYKTVATNGGRTTALAVKGDSYLFRVPTTFGADGKWTTGTTEGYIVPSLGVANPVIRLTFGDATPAIAVDGSTGSNSMTSEAKVYICRIPGTSSSSGTTVKFEAGKVYTYTVEVSGTTPEVGVGGSITDWVAAGSVPIINAY